MTPEQFTTFIDVLIKISTTLCWCNAWLTGIFILLAALVLINAIKK